MNFAGEEMGLLGSAWYVAHPVLPLDKAVAMINMDMIGRIRDGKVYIGGTATGTGLRPLLEKVAPKYPLKVDYSEGPESSSSDHTSFIAGQVSRRYSSSPGCTATTISPATPRTRSTRRTPRSFSPWWLKWPTICATNRAVHNS